MFLVIGANLAKFEHIFYLCCMKYISRIIRYFVFVCLLMALIVTALVLLKIVDSNVGTMFRNGYDSLWQIALMFLGVSCIYPLIAYGRRGVIIPGEYGQIREEVIGYMEERGYELVLEEGENLTFRLRSVVSRIFRYSDSTITMTRDFAGFYLEGAVKDTVRLKSGLEQRFNSGREA